AFFRNPLTGKRGRIRRLPLDVGPGPWQDEAGGAWRGPHFCKDGARARGTGRPTAVPATTSTPGGAHEHASPGRPARAAVQRGRGGGGAGLQGLRALPAHVVA